MLRDTLALPAHFLGVERRPNISLNNWMARSFDIEDIHEGLSLTTNETIVFFSPLFDVTYTPRVCLLFAGQLMTCDIQIRGLYCGWSDFDPTTSEDEIP